MEHHKIYKITKLLNHSTVSKFVTRKWIEVSDLPGSQYSVNKNIRFKTPMLRSDLRDYSYANIVVKQKITVRSTNLNNQTNKKLAFIDNAEDLDIAMLMYNLLE